MLSGWPPKLRAGSSSVDVPDNTRVEAGQVLFRIDPRPFELAVAEAQAQVEQIGQTLGASTADVNSAQARVVEGGRRTRERSGPDGPGFRTCQTGRLPRRQGRYSPRRTGCRTGGADGPARPTLSRRGKSSAPRVLTIPSSRRRLRRWSVRGSTFFIQRSRPLPTAWSPISNWRPASSSGQGRRLLPSST